MLETFVNTILGTLPSMAVTVLATLAVTMIFKTSLTTNFAQGVISAVGSYVVLQLLTSGGVPVYIGVIPAILVGAGIGVFIDLVIFRNGRSVNLVGKQIITMGLVSVLVGVIPFVFSVSRMESVPLIPVVNRGLMWKITENITIQINTLIYVGVTALIVAVIFVLLNYSKWGLGVRATASNEYIAGMMGINTRAITAISWAIAGAVGAVCAVMYAGFVQMSNSLFLTTVQVNAFLAGILGGFATFHGPILAAVLIYLIYGVIGCVCILVPELSTWKEVMLYVVILLLVLWKPQGLFGPRAVKKV